MPHSFHEYLIFVKFGACSAEFGAPGRSWQSAPPVREPEYVGCVVPPRQKLHHFVCSQLCLLHTTRPQLHLSVPLKGLHFDEGFKVSFGTQVSGLLGGCHWVAWHGCLGQVRISCRTKRRARARAPPNYLWFKFRYQNFLEWYTGCCCKCPFLDAVASVTVAPG